MIHCFYKNAGNYGRIRIKKLAHQEIAVSKNKTARILHENGMEAKSGRTGCKKSPKPTEEWI